MNPARLLDPLVDEVVAEILSFVAVEPFLSLY
jgi:hypothetical protein